METKKELFYLRDSRTNCGTSAMFWAIGGNGYTTSLDKAEKFTREDAIKKYKMRETDIPVRCDLADARAYLAVDFQDLRSVRDYVDERKYHAGNFVIIGMRGYDGNNVYFASKVSTHNFSNAHTMPLRCARSAIFPSAGFMVCKHEDVNAVSRRVVKASRISTRRVLAAANIEYIKKQRQLTRKCRECGKFMANNQPPECNFCGDKN